MFSRTIISGLAKCLKMAVWSHGWRLRAWNLKTLKSDFCTTPTFRWWVELGEGRQERRSSLTGSILGSLSVPIHYLFLLPPFLLAGAAPVLLGGSATCLLSSQQLSSCAQEKWLLLQLETCPQSEPNGFKITTQSAWPGQRLLQEWTETQSSSPEENVQRGSVTGRKN